MLRKLVLLAFLTGAYFLLPSTAVRADDCGYPPCDLVAAAVCPNGASDYCCCGGTCGWDCNGAATNNCEACIE